MARSFFGSEHIETYLHEVVARERLTIEVEGRLCAGHQVDFFHMVLTLRVKALKAYAVDERFLIARMEIVGKEHGVLLVFRHIVEGTVICLVRRN